MIYITLPTRRRGALCTQLLHSLELELSHVVGSFMLVFVICVGQDIEYIRSHYNIEDFIYFNHHRREEHAHLYHYALNPIFKLFSKMFLKVLMLQSRCCHVQLTHTGTYLETATKYLHLKLLCRVFHFKSYIRYIFIIYFCVCSSAY